MSVDKTIPPAPTPPVPASTKPSLSDEVKENGHIKRMSRDGQLGALPEKCAEVYNLVKDFLHRSPKKDEDADRLRNAQRQTQTSLDIIAEALSQYSLDELAISYNGGKDCLVLLILYLAGLHAFATGQDFSNSSTSTTRGTPRIALPPQLPAIYILSSNPFPSVTSFVTSSAQDYHLSLTSYPTPMVSAFSQHLAAHPQIKAIFVGTRRTDPHGATLTPFAPTDGNWPRFIRIHPVLDWAYVDIWTFIRGLGVEYCDLYDQGYTSLGGRGDTWPNPKLRREGAGPEQFRPAYELVEDDEERLGRERQ